VGCWVECQHASERSELQDIITAVEAEEREREAEGRQEHEQLREEIRNKNLEDINVLRMTLDRSCRGIAFVHLGSGSIQLLYFLLQLLLLFSTSSAIEELESHFEAAHVNYLQSTDQRTADFKELTWCVCLVE
jgi:hypothetical protein